MLPRRQGFRLADLTSPRVREARTGYFPSFHRRQGILAAQGRLEDTSRRNRSARCGRSLGRLWSNAVPMYDMIDDFPAFPLNNIWDGRGGLATEKSYVVQTGLRMVRALPSHDHRPRRPGSRPDVRQRHHGLRRRAVGPTVDHDRHQPRGPDPGPHPPDGRQVPLLPAGRLARRTEEGSGTDRQPHHPHPAPLPRRARGGRRHQPRLRLQARATRHA